MLPGPYETFAPRFGMPAVKAERSEDTPTGKVVTVVGATLIPNCAGARYFPKEDHLNVVIVLDDDSNVSPKYVVSIVYACGFAGGCL